MSDLPVPLSERACALLTAQRTAVARYAALLEGQRAALRAEDPELLADLASQAEAVVHGLETACRHLTVLRTPLQDAAGPRRDQADDLLTALSAELERAFEVVRVIAEQAHDRRQAIVRSIVELERYPAAAAPAGYTPTSAEPAFLDRCG